VKKKAAHAAREKDEQCQKRIDDMQARLDRMEKAQHEAIEEQDQVLKDFEMKEADLQQTVQEGQCLLREAQKEVLVKEAHMQQVKTQCQESVARLQSAYLKLEAEAAQAAQDSAKKSQKERNAVKKKAAHAAREKDEQCQKRIDDMQARLDRMEKAQHEAIEEQDQVLKDFEMKEADLQQTVQEGQCLLREAQKEVLVKEAHMRQVETQCQERVARLQSEAMQQKVIHNQLVHDLMEQLATLSEQVAQLRQNTCDKTWEPKARLLPEPTWQFEVGLQLWEDFVPSLNMQICKAYAAKKAHCQFEFANMLYSMDLDTLMQTNLKTGRQRRVRCTFSIPPHWCSTDAEMMVKLRRQPDCGDGGPTFESVVHLVNNKCLQKLSALLRSSVFHHSGNGGSCRADFSLKRAFHVENLQLYSDYSRSIKSLREKFNEDQAPQLDPALLGDLAVLAKEIKCDSDINECLLFHGCSFEVAKHIAVSGFDFRMAKSNGYYGRGTYFASQSCKAAQYSERKASDNTGLFTMIISRVALGNPHFIDHVDMELGRPPLPHDSVIARPGPMRLHKYMEQTHCEFVIYERMQAYPEYILQFERFCDHVCF